MAILIPYLIKLSISLAVVYLFYQLFLRRLTFYNWNRWYLLIYSFLSFFIPFINIYPVLEKNNWDNSGVLELIPAVSYQANTILLPVEETRNPWTLQDWTLLLIGIGAVIMLGRLLIQQISFIRIRRSSTLLLNDRIKVYQVNKNIIPFSYGNSIFVNQHQHSQEELKEIIRHEFIHVKQKHTLDILWAELLCILNWYNPFAWLIRKSIRQNLEFIADNKVLQNGIDKKEYQYLLLKVIGVSQFSVATQFNFSSLKKRIAMMNKIKSAKVHLLKFLFMLPLMAVLLVSFRNSFYRREDKTVYWLSGLVMDVATNLPLKDAVVNERNSGEKTTTDNKGYFKLPVPFNGKEIDFAIVCDKPGYQSAKLGLRNSKMQFESNNGNIEFVYLAKNNGAQTHSQYFHGEPDYSIIRKRYNEHVAIAERDKKIDAMVGNSTKPIWIIDGIPYVVGYGLKAWFDKEEVDASPEFKISVDGKLMSMDEANTTINRSEIVGVAASGVETSRKELGVPMNVFILYLDKPVNENKVDTTPAKQKFPTNVSSISINNDIATVKLKNGKVEKYNLNNEEEEIAFEKKYGKWMPPPPPSPPTQLAKPPSPPLPPVPRTEEHVRIEQKENSKGYIVTVADNNGECVVIIKDKDKKIVKAMALTEWNDHEFENAAKYGEIPAAPVKEAIPAIPVPANPPSKTRVGGVEVAPVPAKPAVPAPGIDQGIIIAPSQEKFYVKPVPPSNHQVKPAVRIRNIAAPSDDVLFIIDGVKQPIGTQVLNKIDPNDIESIQILKDGTSIALYGEQAVVGVVLITTKNSTGEKTMDLDKLENFEGLIIVDGEEVKKEKLNEQFKTEDIESVTILKNEEATKAYGDKGKKGVIIIKTKKKNEPVVVNNLQFYSNKTPGAVDQQKPDEDYIDRVDVKEGVMNWTLIKNSKKHPLILLEKRIIGRGFDAAEKLVSMTDISEVEFIGRGDLLKQYGDDAKGGIINFITKANKDNQTVRMIPKKKISEEELTAMLAEAAKLNVLYIAIENPLKIQVDNIPVNELEVKLEGGIVFQRNGFFYAIPQSNEGRNAKVDIYKKLKNGETQLLNSRYFRVRALPQQSNLIVSR